MNAGRSARWVPVLWTLLLTAGAQDAGASQLPADASALPIPAQMAPSASSEIRATAMSNTPAGLLPAITTISSAVTAAMMQP